ncbi:hypothetical protein T265_11646 [Opisthorchis viverrini]|uniref:Uncharacterized protein n=1 Tax=Opisthorchis viverrini TaxID=6198 RepID=A0A074Z2A4_OPIVI|nr:hypothetical protein T265_11646 [Opisthorchis viverrini]KER19632.1 hypothetical protein T265_11646 [Opisthorchis viverrini]
MAARRQKGVTAGGPKRPDRDIPDTLATKFNEITTNDCKLWSAAECASKARMTWFRSSDFEQGKRTTSSGNLYLATSGQSFLDPPHFLISVDALHQKSEFVEWYCILDQEEYMSSSCQL